MRSILNSLFPVPTPAPVVHTPSPETQNRALSIQQPHAEMILRGFKKIEYRSRITRIRGRVFLYASKRPAAEEYFKKNKAKPGDFPTGVLVGTVEIIGCEEYGENDYGWMLANPERLETPVKPDNQAQPVWFIPFSS